MLVTNPKNVTRKYLAFMEEIAFSEWLNNQISRWALATVCTADRTLAHAG
jgi:hypothetical protein